MKSIRVCNFLFVAVIVSQLGCKDRSRGSIVNVKLHDNWEFSMQGSDHWSPAVVPGVIHLDLLNNEMIDDPFWEDNEIKQRWIEEKNWIYRCFFEVGNDVLKKKNVELLFEGLDTYAEVKLNDNVILSTDNMFRSWTADVKKLLLVGKNEINIQFTSPINYNKSSVEDHPFLLPSGNEAGDVQTKVSSFTRKAAYHFGWDWGPRFVTTGVWRPVQIRAWNDARILDHYVQTVKIHKNTAEMLSIISIDVTAPGLYILDIDGVSQKKNLIRGVNVIKHRFEVQNPLLWWCNGSGEPNLYVQKLKVARDGIVLGSTATNYGIRTVELINKKDSIGTSFYFILNGNATFIQGANYIPQDVFLPRVSKERYRNLLVDVQKANMNMIRVWGGGIYEDDYFYNLCDSLGILVWQDFMFANSLYPITRKDFNATVVEEVKENIIRLRKHPCIATWCGNNEIDVAFHNWGWQKQYGYSTEDSTTLWRDYIYMFQILFKDLVRQYSPHIPYTATSPLSNWGTAENFNHSSMHYWGVWHGKDAFEEFENNVGRFMVEYGFQSFPEIATLKNVLADSSLNLESAAMKHRQKSYIGNGLILDHIKQYNNEPKTFEEFVILSQEVQARGLQMAIRAHKSAKGHCMGTLFWQLNDCWPGPSWSVIDYYGDKKKAYDVVREEYIRLKN